MNYFNMLDKKIIIAALKEDIGKGDITTKLLISPKIKKEAIILAKEKGVVCGIQIAGLVFKTANRKIEFVPLVKDGYKVNKDTVLAKLYGSASHILSAERVALNFLGFLSGVATYTNKFVTQIQG
ncbi:MAG: nicotinate-nucleotide diphosphorylase (carboxylating), partial [Candidatus Omnitrophica bacterium]|nr:nicotinate-nucleotide diphosphorylase (carboxylating) [Candidatus Omnitrophota bacterium]